MVMRVFVAGGNGVVGLVPQLVARGHEVTATATGRGKLGMLERLGEQPRVFRTGFLLVLCHFLAVQPSVVHFLRRTVSES
jgi:nucleoside-diphosphate-sugar epimerase